MDGQPFSWSFSHTHSFFLDHLPSLEEKEISKKDQKMMENIIEKEGSNLNMFYGLWNSHKFSRNFCTAEVPWISAELPQITAQAQKDSTSRKIQRNLFKLGTYLLDDVRK